MKINPYKKKKKKKLLTSLLQQNKELHLSTRFELASQTTNDRPIVDNLSSEVYSVKERERERERERETMYLKNIPMATPRVG
jgi:hypothetical protein